MLGVALKVLSLGYAVKQQKIRFRWCRILRGEVHRAVSSLWLRAIGVIKVVVILAPIVLAIIYLPPFVRKAIDKYEDIIPGLEKAQEIIEGQGNNIL